MIWVIFVLAGITALFRQKSFAFEVISAVLCVSGLLYGLYSGMTLSELLPPLMLYCALTLLAKGGGEK